MSEPDNRNYLQEELQRRMRDFQYERYLTQARNRRHTLLRRLVALALAISSLGLAAYVIFFSESEFLRIPITIAVAVAFSGFALSYLQPSSSSRDISGDTESYFQLRHYIDERLAETIQTLKEPDTRALTFSEQDKAAIVASIQAKLESEALQKYVEGIQELVASRIRDESLDERLQYTRRRLGQEVQDLAKRGNLNLVLGILTTLGGLSVLGYAVFNPPATLAAPELLSYFVPRVSLVVLIEVFAYFFLRLYKQSLAEIKYFQNELTNVEAKQLALQVTLRVDDVNLRSKLVEELARTERNFILTKDQTTVELERERMARGTYAGVTEAIKEALKKKGDS